MHTFDNLIIHVGSDDRAGKFGYVNVVYRVGNDALDYFDWTGKYHMTGQYLFQVASLKQ